MPVSTKHQSFISVGTGLVHPSVHTKSHLHALKLQQVLTPDSLLPILSGTSSLKDRQIAQSPCISKWLKCLHHYFLPHLISNTDAKREVSSVIMYVFHPNSWHRHSISWFQFMGAPYAEQQYLKCLSVSGKVCCAYVITLNKAYQLSKAPIGSVKYIGST